MKEKNLIDTTEKTDLEKIEEEIKEFHAEEVQEESIRVQKAKWVREQVDKQREIEDATRTRIEQEQKLLDEMKRSTEEHLERTKELRRFNEDTRAQMRMQVFELNGITEDKLQGMKEYKNAYYQGMALAFFLLSVGLVGLSAFLHGFDSKLCLFMVAFTGIEGALLSQESKRGKMLEAICRFLYILIFPIMLVAFVCYELQVPQFEVVFPYVVMAGCVVLLLGTVAYFVYNPYHKDKKKLRSVREDLKEIEDEAEKAVRRNQRRRKRQEARLARKLKREQKRVEWQKEREEKRIERKKKQEIARIDRKKRLEEFKRLIKKENIEADAVVIEATVTEVESEGAKEATAKEIESEGAKEAAVAEVGSEAVKESAVEEIESKVTKEVVVTNQKSNTVKDNTKVTKEANANTTKDEEEPSAVKDEKNENDNVVELPKKSTTASKRKRRR